MHLIVSRAVSLYNNQDTSGTLLFPTLQLQSVTSLLLISILFSGFKLLHGALIAPDWRTALFGICL